jgi:hypothetical protein
MPCHQPTEDYVLRRTTEGTEVIKGWFRRRVVVNAIMGSTGRIGR